MREYDSRPRGAGIHMKARDLADKLFALILDQITDGHTKF